MLFDILGILIYAAIFLPLATLLFKAWVDIWFKAKGESAVLIKEIEMLKEEVNKYNNLKGKLLAVPQEIREKYEI